MRYFSKVLFVLLAQAVLSSNAHASPDTLVRAIASDPKSFNDIVAQETSTQEVTGYLFEGLTRLNPITGEVEPWLAEHWEISEDQKTWVFFLKKEVRWFDGTSFTARDVVFTFNRLIYNDDIIAAARDIFTLAGERMTVEAVDDHAVRFQLPSAFAPFLLALGQPILPAHVLGPAVESGNFSVTWGTDEDPDQIIGTGPFRLASYEPGERVELVRNENYWRKDAGGRSLPHIEKIVLLIIPSPDGRLLKFMEGESDVYDLTGKDFPLLKPLEKARRFKLYEVGASMHSNFLTFNQASKDKHKRAWFQNRNFRRAIAHALDRDALIHIVYQGLGMRQCSPVSPSTPHFYLQTAACYDYDLSLAKSLLSHEGFEDRDGDGILEDAGGNPVEFVLSTNAENTERLQILAMIREDLARLGFKVHFLPMEFNSLVAKLVATGEWDAVLIGLTGSPDPHFGANVWRSKGTLHFWDRGSAVSGAAWQDRIDQVYDEALATLDTESRRELYNEWQEVAVKELPLIYTVIPEVIYAVRNRLTNVNPSVLGGAINRIDEVEIVETAA
ncbi:MAG: ABC transporter substrate-binding protein [Candidatus Omnitrophota bacterium]|nr:ABC transporter substrate-binding protein [Candidatus Omnitrophota bacterium]